MCALPLEQEIEYPTSDGQPMAETTLHRVVMSDVIEGLERRFADTPDVWVGGNLFLYYEKGNPLKSVSPDVLFARGVGKAFRDTYLLWNETVPSLVFEITSRKTRREDTHTKKDLYERLGVTELVLFDPYGDYLRPRLQGWRLDRGRYQPIPPNADSSLDLWTAGVTVLPEGERLRLVDTSTGKKLLWIEELESVLRRETAARQAAEERAATAEERAAAEAAARREAEERARALEEELERLRRS